MPEAALPKDTSVDAARVQIAVWQGKSMDRRVRAAVSMSEAVWRNCEAGIRRNHPEYSPREVRLAALRLRLGEETFARAFPGVTVLP